MIRKTSRLLTAAATALALLSFPAAAQSEEPAAEPQTAQEIVAAMQPGWNLGNSFDSMCCGDDETAWGNPRTDAGLLEAVREQGFNSIRIPVSWGNHTGPAPDYTIDPEVLDRVEEVVDLALDEGFYVMINTHHDSWQWITDMPAQHDAVMAQYDATWTQIAERFKDHPKELVFESVNEVGFTGSSGAEEDHRFMAELNGSFHDIVRSSGSENADRLLVLPTLHTGADQVHMDALAAEIEALDDPMLAATTHNYSYWPFSVNIAGVIRYDESVQAMLEENFQSQVDTFVSKGIPVIIGEYGLLDGYDVKVERGEAMKFFEHFSYLARTTGITTMWWDNGTHFDRFVREWRDEEQFDYISSGWETRSGTASSDLVFVDASRVRNQSVELNLNGLDFRNLYFGNSKLKEGRDYTLDGTTLTLKKKLLKRILGDGCEPGTTARLEVRFSAGVPWTLNVIAAEDPVLADAAGTTASLVIPAEFNGDRVATMEAFYADGTFAGPHDWTSFKEYWDAFRPDHEDGEIELPARFFENVRDGDPVTLTFHFWSGKTLEYTVTRTGTAVTGTA
ncbi:cellulase family glycosylhydrolase [Glycomyces dulcitolivorans]|uniref:cellulase family glycosylhydrolase n=1 Tax=Glycomyces dulcitolivorans TaxID=2200759 RepID=UPI0018E4FDCA|nr:cellulase family glycosylhydrolase [Glycomyces dulcitolivorans]